MADLGTTLQTQKAENLFDGIFGGISDDQVKQDNPRLTTPYTIRYENWYKTIPYAFRIVHKSGPTGLANAQNLETGYHFFFPVNPESISINTPFATVVTPTLGGIVQEHSGAVFYHITISGTTGVIPNIDYTTGGARTPDELRPLVNQGGLIGSNVLGGFGQNTINAINSAVSAITGVSSKMASSTQNRRSGYTAFHVLYKFLWLYHFAKANGSKDQLRFMNYKDNNQYDCVVESFSLTRDKSRPHLYQYQIQLKGWKLATVNQDIQFQQPDLSALGLGEGPSVKALLFRAVNETKTVLNGASGLLNAAAGDLAF